MKTVAIIQARMGSTRLPGKVLMPLGDSNAIQIIGYSNAIQIIVDKCKANPVIDEVVIATSENPLDDTIVGYCLKQGIEFYVGPEENVLKRVLRAARCFNADIIVDITGDCPLVDLADLEDWVDMIKHNDCDYISNIIERTYPDGLDLQVYTLKALEQLYKLVAEPEYTQHTGWNFTRFHEQFKLINVSAHGDLRWPELRITLDTQADYDLIHYLFVALGPDPSPKRIVHHLKNNLDLLRINQDVKTKQPGEI